MPAQTTVICAAVGTLIFTRPVRLINKGIDRAIVQHPIPTRGDDIGQDMNLYSRRYALQGLCTPPEKTTLELFALSEQINATYPSGRCTIQQTDDNGSIHFNQGNLAFKSLRYDYEGGFPHMYRFTAEFIEFNQP